MAKELKIGERKLSWKLLKPRLWIVFICKTRIAQVVSLKVRVFAKFGKNIHAQRNIVQTKIQMEPLL